MTRSHQGRLRIALTADPELAVPPSHYGGIERIIDMLARALIERGHEVTLFARGGSNCPVNRIAWPGRHSTRLLDTVGNSVTLSRYVLAGRFDIVHSFSRIAYLLPILPLSMPKLMTFQRAVSPRTTAMASRLSRGTLEFSAISRQMVEAVPLAGRWHHVPNGVPLNVYDFRECAGPDAPLVFLGRVEEIKGPHLAIEIARRAGRRLVIAGNIPVAHRSWFEAHVAPHIDGQRVRYVGPVDDKEKNILLGEAAALLMPILWDEPFGIVMAEAMACGTPVLGLRRGAVPEVVEHAVTGFVADTVDELVTFVDRLGELDRAAARTRVERFYSDEAVTEGYLKVYANMRNPKSRLRQAPAAKTMSER
jgi:glycosyltransferase involved in cell wall biosynthesis